MRNRFDYEECYLTFDGGVFAIAENKKNAGVIGETLIQLFDENEQLKEERDYFERKKCDYQKKISILTTDKIQLKQENEQLKIDLGIAEDNHKLDKEIIDDIHNEFQKVKKENEQLKQFQDRVFSWIDMHLQRLPTLRDEEFESDDEFADPSLYSGAIQILETMKRELKGD